MPINWTRDEIIVAMAYYLRYDYKQGGIDRQKMAYLSDLFRSLHLFLGADLNIKSRSMGSIKGKLENFKTLDPTYNGMGLPNISKADQHIWASFYPNQQYLFKLADTIEQNLKVLSAQKKIQVLPKADQEDYVFEGQLLSRIHHYRERNSKIIKLKKQWAWDTHGALYCEACTFDFHDFYGDYGQGYIECHHNTPLSELRIQETTKTTLNDLSLLCANCHRMIHYTTPWETVEGIKQIIQP